MLCPYCGSDSSVTETRYAPDGVRRRRVCSNCRRRFTTYEKVGAPGLKVEKRSRKPEPFDAEKLTAALTRVCRYRPVRADDIRRVVRDIEAMLIDHGGRSVRWSDIVLRAIERLEPIDRVSADRLRANYVIEDGSLRLDLGPPEDVPQLDLPGVAEELDEG